MSKTNVVLGVTFLFATAGNAAVIDTTDPTVIQAFQNGATVIDFESLSGLPGLNINAFTSGIDVSGATDALLLQQLQPGGGVGTTSGGGVGTVVLNLGDAIKSAASSGTHVLGSGFDGSAGGTQTTCFQTGCFMEFFFEQGVNKFGFHANSSVFVIASKADVKGIVASNNVQLDLFNGTAGSFVGIELATNDINFVQVFATSDNFVIDDLTYDRDGGTGVVPEPSSLALMGAGALLLCLKLRGR